MQQFWDPDAAALGLPGYYWPPRVPRDWKVDTLKQIFALHGYSVCADLNLEDGYEKVAFYFNDQEDEISHVSRQLSNGRWISKLGLDEDIEHNTLEALESDPRRFPPAYGRIIQIMRRPRQ